MEINLTSELNVLLKVSLVFNVNVKTEESHCNRMSNIIKVVLGQEILLFLFF